jgi:MSHA type pilus biogenesis protein MshL
MTHYYLKYLLAVLLTFGVLISCSPSQDPLTTLKRMAGDDEEASGDMSKIPDYIDPYLKLSRDDYTNTLLPRHKKAQAKENDIPKLSSTIADPKPAPLANGKLVSLSVTEDVPLKDVLIELSRLADIDLELDPRISGGIILRVKNKPVEEVIERVARLGRLRYEAKDGVLRVERDLPYTVHYPANFLNLTRSNSGGISISTSVLSGGGSGSSGGDSGSSSSTSSASTSSGGGSSSSGGGGLSSGSQNSISSEYDGDLWTAVSSGITNILSQMDVAEASETGGASTSTPATQAASAISTAASTTGGSASSANTNSASVTVNRQAGIITITANKRQHDKIKDYLERIKRSVSSQVLIEAKVLEVSLNDDYRSGINWSLTDDNVQLSTTGSFVNALTGQDSLFAISGLSKTPIGNLEAAINFTQKFGTTRTISSPRLLATNNQQAVLTFAKNQIYFTLEAESETESTTTNSTSTSSVTSTMNSVPIGVILTLQPSIDLDNNEIMMNIRPTLSRITDHVNDPATTVIARRENITDIVSEIPIVEVREMDSILKIHNGQVMVIGGLMEERANNTDQGVPGASRIPVLGNLFKSVEKTSETVETVIFLKATIVPGTYADEHDQKLYETFSSDPRPLAF